MGYPRRVCAQNGLFDIWDCVKMFPPARILSMTKRNESVLFMILFCLLHSSLLRIKIHPADFCNFSTLDKNKTTKYNYNILGYFCCSLCFYCLILRLHKSCSCCFSISTFISSATKRQKRFTACAALRVRVCVFKEIKKMDHTFVQWMYDTQQ